MKVQMDGLPPDAGDLEIMRREVMGQMSALLENQMRTNFFAAAISHLIFKVHDGMMADLKACLNLDSAAAPLIQEIMDQCRHLDGSLAFLCGESRRQWLSNAEHLKDVLKEFGSTISYLSETLVERDLFERQSQVLEQIVLSHEKVAHWQAFIQEILTGFHEIFHFDFFYIGFAELGKLELYIYYFCECGDLIKQSVQETLSSDLRKRLDLASDTPIDVKEYLVEGKGVFLSKKVQMLNVAIPDQSQRLAGVLGLAYSDGLSVNELAIIRSLLSVMVMVVGSSKVLSRNLEELEYYSGHDPLTGLYNRRFFTEILDYEVGRSARHQHEFSVMLLDLDNFKDINDSFGHPTGDETLIKIANCLNENARIGDVATRIGGDEFAIILPETPATEARVVAEMLRVKLQGIPFFGPDKKHYRITTSIGLASFPKDGRTPNDLMAGVDAALYHAKGLGKNEVSTLESVALHVQQTRDGRLFAEELRQALNEGRIAPYFQPIVDCKTGALYANEALARMIQTDGSTISAGSFIETVERYGLAKDLDAAILVKSLTLARDYLLRIGKPTRIFINLAPQEIKGRGILSHAEDLCSELDLPPECVVFEIVEREMMGDMSNMRKFLTHLREKGFAFALDDFGSGYNSLHYLRELHFEYVKIDGAFIRNIQNSRVDRALVLHLSRLCQDLGILMIAESVESMETLAVLQDMGIDYAQGYAIGMPTPWISLDLQKAPFMTSASTAFPSAPLRASP